VKLVVNPHADELLLEKMLAPPPLEQARSSLEFWRQRRRRLPFFRLAERREADEMIRRWRIRVEAAERARFGTGLYGRIRRLLVLETPYWPFGPKTALVAFAWRMLPRRLAMVALAALGVMLISLVALGLGVAILVLQVA
jgi:hypothetical protein